MEIDVAMCLAGRDLTEPKLSPDGNQVAFVVRWGSSAAIITVPSDGGPERILTTEPSPAPGRGFGGGCFAWLPDGSAIVYAGRDGDLWLQPVPGGPSQRLTEVGEGRRCEGPSISTDGIEVAAVVDQGEVWVWNLATRNAERVDDGSADFVFDPSPMPAGAGSGWVWQAWNVPDMPWDASRAVSARRTNAGWERSELVPAASIQQLGRHPDGRRLSVRDDTGWLNVWLGDEPLVDEPYEHAGPTWGMGQRSYALSPDASQVAFSRNEAGFGRLCVVDIESRQVHEIARGVHGQIGWVGNRVVALRSGARTPTQIVTYDPASWQRTVLAIGPVGGWEGVDLPEPGLVEAEHDGVTLHGRLFDAGHGRTICWVHGGPTDQWQVEFMPRIAYWWAQGWDVLVPDPRGTTGHGRSYQQALLGEWGRRDIDDTAALLRAHHASGRGQPDRTVMMGSSSGGLTVLGLLARHPHLAVGGVVRYPVADLSVLATASHRFEAHYTLGLVGPLEHTETYRQRSPVYYADEIGAPLLVLHGDSDPVVPLSSTVDLVERIRAAGGEAELVVYEGEGHGFRDPDHQRDEYRRIAEFLVSVVDGR